MSLNQRAVPTKQGQNEGNCPMLPQNCGQTTPVSIDDFGVSNATLLGHANSDQTSIKCHDLTCDVELMLLKNYKHLSMKLEVKHSQLHLQVHIFIFMRYLKVWE